MRGLRRLFLLLIALSVVGLTVFFLLGDARGQEVGPPIALCPGPDGYGYRCTGEPLQAYVDASNDTELYLDDDLVLLELPFTFTFYGVDYDEVWASSNGNLQFGSGDNSYDNVCLTPEPAAGLGEMIAPYWDDLTLAFDGFLETEVVGQAPERVFVVEWDGVPKFGSVDDLLTFEVQLYEGSNDIVFLYEDAQTLAGPNGSQATIGLQSEQQGYALQASCNQIAVFDGSAIHFVHPEAAPADMDAPAQPPAAERPAPSGSPGKGAAGQLVDALNRRGRAGLVGLQAGWMSQRPWLASDWRWADLDGDGRQELVVLWWGEPSRPELLEIAVAGLEGDGQWQLLWQSWPLARQDRLRSLALAGQGDVTGDGAEEIILADPLGGGQAALMRTAAGYELVELPGRCDGSLLLRDANADGALEIVRGGCPGGGRWTIQWADQEFIVSGGRR